MEILVFKTNLNDQHHILKSKAAVKSASLYQRMEC